MKVLIGTTNPSKLRMFEEWLEGYPVEFVTLSDLGITGDPSETGDTPTENARLKAEYYGQFADYCICQDSGLYLDALPLDDPRQPGLHIRTPQGKRLSDDEMIAYYSSLAGSLGGPGRCILACGQATRETPPRLAAGLHLPDDGWQLFSGQPVQAEIQTLYRYQHQESMGSLFGECLGAVRRKHGKHRISPRSGIV